LALPNRLPGNEGHEVEDVAIEMHDAALPLRLWKKRAGALDETAERVRDDKLDT
jgi:hypothetical protein